jgi:diacylglycerol kinase (ATP)
MIKLQSLKLLFIINSKAGNTLTDWAVVIRRYFATTNHSIELYYLDQNSNEQIIKTVIETMGCDRVIAVGGDGTVRMVAKCLLGKNIPLGIIPAGSANGLAKELSIPTNPQIILDIIERGQTLKMHVLKINDQLCIHLSDIGLNAYAMKKFKTQNWRGMWGYLKASLKVLWHNPLMGIEIEMNNTKLKINAQMMVIANATKYGSGALINPIGKIDDDLFELVVIKKISLWEIYKMIYSHATFDLNKTEVFQTKHLILNSSKKVYFQIDGEYIGKVNKVEAKILPNSLEIIVP